MRVKVSGLTSCLFWFRKIIRCHFRNWKILFSYWVNKSNAWNIINITIIVVVIILIMVCLAGCPAGGRTKLRAGTLGCLPAAGDAGGFCGSLKWTLVNTGFPLQVKLHFFSMGFFSLVGSGVKVQGWLGEVRAGKGLLVGGFLHVPHTFFWLKQKGITVKPSLG